MKASMRGLRAGRMTVLAVGAVLVGLVVDAPRAQIEGDPDLQTFFLTTAADDDRADVARDAIGEAWRHGYGGIIFDLLRFMRPPAQPPHRTAPFSRQPDRGGPVESRVELEHPSTRVWRRLVQLFEDKTDLRLGGGLADLQIIQRWMWQQPYEPHPEYMEFKGRWYGLIDPAFAEFFQPGLPSTIRLDEVDWGGVAVNGIPPLDYPRHITADDPAAEYLNDDNVVFGLAVNGVARAYPKRILAWHEMALDTLGGVELTIVYCTLCGTVIPYESVVEGRHLTFGTSGLLYRSNKLMFDLETKSLWNTFEGVPVVGTLVNSGVQLTHRSVVTTTWAEWRRRHPGTTVLSVDTGHQRDYSEGAAYREYFATERLMFDVPALDDRLGTKDEVVVLLAEGPSGTRHPLAIAVEFLEANRVFHVEHAGYRLVVLTSPEGANRVYDVGAHRFVQQLEGYRVAEETGAVWHVGEDALTLGTDETRTLSRFAAQRAFWFGWYAQFPETVLIH